MIVDLSYNTKGNIVYGEDSDLLLLVGFFCCYFVDFLFGFVFLNVIGRFFL